MSELGQEVKNSLDEARLFGLAVQVFLGFQMRAPFEPRFTSLAQTALSPTVAPAAFHRIAENGEGSERVAGFGSRMVLTALAPLACGLVIDGYVVLTQASVGPLIAVGLPAAFLATAVPLWAVYPFVVRRRRRAH